MSNELQKDDFILPGNLGSVNVGGVNQEITEVFKSKEGATTITIAPTSEKSCGLAKLKEWLNEELKYQNDTISLFKLNNKIDEILNRQHDIDGYMEEKYRK